MPAHQRIWEHGQATWTRLQDRKILITGATGFFGRSILSVLADFEARLGLTVPLTLLSRDPEAFKEHNPSLALSPHWTFIKGDVTNFEPVEKSYDYILHLATPASAQMNREQPLEMMKVIVDGQKHILELARKLKVKTVLFASSGAVYGPQLSDVTHVAESYNGAPSTQETHSSYGESKRFAELMGCLSSATFGFEFKIARCFAFVGPYLDPHGSYAIGNFIRDAISKDVIHIQGDGTALRSYLYADDLVYWLFKILLDGKNQTAYNVGSDEDISIKQLAEKVRTLVNPNVKIEIAQMPKSGSVPARYVPSIELAKRALDLKVFTSLDEAVRLTANTFRQN